MRDFLRIVGLISGLITFFWLIIFLFAVGGITVYSLLERMFY